MLMFSALLTTLRRYPLRITVALLLIPAGVLLLTDGITELAYRRDLQQITLSAGDYSLSTCAHEVGHEPDADAMQSTCVEILSEVLVARDERVTYYDHEPNFDQLRKIRGADESLTIWYAPRESRILFTRLGTLRAARLGDSYLVDVVNTFLSRRRLSARSSTFGVVIVLVFIPALLWRPAFEYLSGHGL